jgi:hypothetical protein
MVCNKQEADIFSMLSSLLSLGFMQSAWFTYLLEQAGTEKTIVGGVIVLTMSHVLDACRSGIIKLWLDNTIGVHNILTVQSEGIDTPAFVKHRDKHASYLETAARERDQTELIAMMARLRKSMSITPGIAAHRDANDKALYLCHVLGYMSWLWMLTMCMF